MEIEFNNIDVKTVKPDYSWDRYNPHLAIVQDAAETETEIVGYSPFVNVKLSATPTNLTANTLILVNKINFGDYYNLDTNTQTAPFSTLSQFCHNYVMPGEYTITLDVDEFVQLNKACCEPSCQDNPFRSSDTYSEQDSNRPRLPYSWMWYCFMQRDYDPRTEFFGGLESQHECLTWDDLVFQGPRQATWDETTGPAFEVRSRPVSWQWKKVVCNPELEELYTQKIPWHYTKQKGIISKTWKQIKEIGCGSTQCIESIPLLSAHKTSKSYTKKIKVIEIPPNAYLSVVGEIGNTSPTTVQLTPRFTKCGSFPIEKIIWDLGDGTPIFEQTRWSINKDSKFVYNKAIERDGYDPRNFDVVHTYTRTANDTSCFYPSITAVASSTSTTNEAATVVGPLKLPSLSNFNIIQNELTDTGKAYVGQIDNQVVFLSRPNK